MAREPYLPASGEHYYKQRMRCFVRDDFHCQCEKLSLPEIPGHCTYAEPETVLERLECHHIKERIAGGTHDLDNLITVCKGHHAMIHPHMRFDLPQPRRSFSMPDREL